MGPGYCFTYKSGYFGTRCLQKYPMKCARFGCTYNWTTDFVTDAKDCMEMNVIAQENVTLDDATVPVWNLL
jgi:hypothetical protein